MLNSPKKRKPRKTLEQKTKKELVKEADKWFSKYIRLRDSECIEGEWLGLCIDGCKSRVTVIDREGRWQPGANAGHYIGRGNFRLRYDEFNVNMQGAYCNAWRDKVSMLEGYRKALDLKYGRGTASRLKRESKQDGSMKFHTKESLLEIIYSSKNYIEYTLSHPNGI